MAINYLSMFVFSILNTSFNVASCRNTPEVRHARKASLHQCATAVIPYGYTFCDGKLLFILQCIHITPAVVSSQ